MRKRPGENFGVETISCNEETKLIVQFVQFDTELSETEMRRVAEERSPQFRAIPTLIQKFYLKFDKPDHYGGFYIWDSPQALADFRKSELASQSLLHIGSRPHPRSAFTN